MNQDRVKGTIDELVGSAKRKTGELTGNTQLQVKGITQQIKGNLENAWGKTKDAVHEANEESTVENNSTV
jgi:uncharacterized protein YjbJ (UPF0337 family)